MNDRLITPGADDCRARWASLTPEQWRRLVFDFLGKRDIKGVEYAFTLMALRFPREAEELRQEMLLGIELRRLIDEED